jgi:MFS family permease
MTSNIRPETGPFEATVPGAAVSPDALLEPSEGPQRMSRWLWVIYPLALISVNVVWGGVLQVMLGRQVAELLGETTAAAGVLGLVISAGAISSLVAQPLLGLLSDKTSSRFLGRRNIWILGSAIAATIALLVTASSPSPIVLAITWAIAMWPLSGLQAALTAVLPERVPVRNRGTMSGLVGASSILGAFGGIAIAGLTTSLFVGYVGIAAVMLVFGTIFALTTKDYVPSLPGSGASKAERRAASRLPSFRSAPDFWWTFVGRFLIVFGYNFMSGMQLYILADYIGVGTVTEAAAVLVAVQGVSTLALLVFSIVGGWLSDRFGRVRVFVALSSLLFAPGALVYLLAPTLTGAFVASGILGVAFGVYLAVDQALITRVLPNMNNAARDLGVMNVANAGPQVIAPALAGALVAATGLYQPLFLVTIVAVILGAISVRFIRGVR